MAASLSMIPRRELFTDERGAGLRVSWHPEGPMVVISIWRDDLCVATFRMAIEDAGDLAMFLVGHLASWAVEAPEFKVPREDLSSGMATPAGG